MTVAGACPEYRDDMPPSPRLLEWAAAALPSSSRLSQLASLRGDGSRWLLQFETNVDITSVVLKIGDSDDPAEVGRLTTEVAALEVARRFGFPAPLPIRTDIEGHATGRAAVLLTALNGSSGIPRCASPARLRTLGGAIARLHAIRPSCGTGLPSRTRPIAGLHFRDQYSVDSSPLHTKAARLVAEMPVPVEPCGFLHGDLWSGNILWHAAELVGFVDWKYAGVGPFGVDLGSIRCDVALLYGQTAADLILAGWADAIGAPIPDMQYWDLVGVLNTPPDISAWIPSIHSQGRADLDRDTLVARLAEFHRAAMGRS
jgi:aminoglycoside phosphotransferase (APT) family kinase protein